MLHQTVSVPDVNEFFKKCCIGSTALRDYFKEEMKYQRDMLDCESISDLPTFKDFEVTL